MKRSSLYTGILAASVASVIAATPAFAQTTQERLEQLLRQLETQQKTLEALSKEVDRLKTAEKDGMSKAPTPKKMVRSKSEKVKLTLKGQVNRAFMVADDGKQSEVFHVDNDLSSTRFDIIAEAKPKKDLKVGGHIEMEVQSNPSNKVTMGQNKPASGTTFAERIVEVYFDSKEFGRLTLGQGKTASDGTSEMDLSGTGVIALSKIHEIAGDITFREKNAAGTAGPSIDKVFSNMDGLSREDRIRYDTPKFNGFQLSTSHADGGETDFAIRHSAKIDGIKTKAAIAYANSSSVDDEKQFNGSASVMFPIGLNFTFAAGTQDADVQSPGDDDPKFWWGKVGWQTRIVEWGKTSFSVDYGQADDLGSQGDEFKSIGGAIVQKLDDYGTEIFVSGRNYSLDQPTTKYHDVFVFISGARIKF